MVSDPTNCSVKSTEKVRRKVVESTEKGLAEGLAGRLVEKGAEYLTQKTTQKIIEAITKKSDITQKELAVVIGITEDSVKYHITRLREKGLLKRIGPDKGGYW